jgi:hypothetical protein
MALAQLTVRFAPSHGPLCLLLCLSCFQERREDLIRKLLDDLGGLCHDLGEDVKAAVTEVHPNLVYMW